MDMGYDGHTLYAECKKYSYKDLMLFLEININKIFNYHKVDNKFYVNFIPGKKKNYAYLYISDTKLYNMLVGYFPDGSKKHSVPQKSIEELSKLKQDRRCYKNVTKWIDIIEMEEEHLNECREIFDNKFLIPYINLDKSIDITLSKSKSVVLPKKFKKNIIECENIPKFINPRIIITMILKITPKNETPRINVEKNNDTNKLCVSFDEFSNSAQFLLLMIDKYNLFDKNSGNSIQLNFKFHTNL